jgi:hypothetical protein
MNAAELRLDVADGQIPISGAAAGVPVFPLHPPTASTGKTQPSGLLGIRHFHARLGRVLQVGHGSWIFCNLLCLSYFQLITTLGVDVFVVKWLHLG